MSLTEAPQQTLHVRTSVKKTSKKEKVEDRGALIDSLVALGYPIARFLRQNPQQESLAKVFNRMRVCYYQNRTEFKNLQPLLKNEMNSLSCAQISQIKVYSQDIVPMWMPPVKAKQLLKQILA